MREFFKSIFFKVLLGIIAIFLGFILYEASTGEISSPSQLLSVISSPFQKVATAISEGIDSLIDPIVSANSYKAENEELKEQIAALNEKLVDYENMKDENEQLMEAAGIKEAHSDFEMVPASIVSRDADAFGTFQINKGELEGLNVGDPVITSLGLVGKVSSVAKTYAYVMPVTSPNFVVNGYDAETKESGMINGDLSLMEDGYCRMLYLDKSTAIKEGNLIVTSGSSGTDSIGVFPTGLQIGTVQEIGVQTNGISSYAIIKPLVDVNEISSVLVITDFDGKGLETGNDGSSSEEGN